MCVHVCVCVRVCVYKAHVQYVFNWGGGGAVGCVGVCIGCLCLSAHDGGGGVRRRRPQENGRGNDKRNGRPGDILSVTKTE